MYGWVYESDVTLSSLAYGKDRHTEQIAYKLIANYPKICQQNVFELRGYRTGLISALKICHLTPNNNQPKELLLTILFAKKLLW